MDFYRGRSSLLDLSSWTTSDYVIDYTTGFVRRGLTGWLFELAGITDVASWLLWAGLTLSVLVDVVVIVRLVRTGNRNPLLWAVVLFAPNLLFFRINDPDAMFRKELFFIPVILLQLLALRLPTPQFARAQWITVGGLGTIATLGHESFVFLCLPVLMLISALKVIPATTEAQGRRSWTFLPACLPVLAGILCFTHLGDREIAQRICESQHRHFRSQLPCTELAGALYAMADRDVYLTEARQMYTRRYVLLHWGFLFTSFFAFVATASVACATAMARSLKPGPFSQSRFMSYAVLVILIIFAGTAPLYVIAIDWGRWFCFSSLTLFLCLSDKGFVRALTTISEGTDGWSAEPSAVAISPIIQWLIAPIVVLQMGLFSIPRCCLSTQVKPTYATLGKISQLREPLRLVLTR